MRRLAHPADQRHGHERPGAGAPVLLDEAVGGRAVGQRRRVRVVLGDVLEVPVAAGVVDVVLPVVAGGGVAAPAAHRQAQLGGQLLVGEVHPVDVVADGVASGADIDAQGTAGPGEGAGGGPRTDQMMSSR